MQKKIKLAQMSCTLCTHSIYLYIMPISDYLRKSRFFHPFMQVANKIFTIFCIFSSTFICHFDMSMNPFDVQVCAIYFRLNADQKETTRYSVQCSA